jgi:hypothetical protein
MTNENQGGEALMTDMEVRQWIDACNHEPARNVLRKYLELGSPPALSPSEQPEPVAGSAEWQIARARREPDCIISAGADLRPETTSEHIARDMREGRFPKQSEPQMVPVQPLYAQPSEQTGGGGVDEDLLRGLIGEAIVMSADDIEEGGEENCRVAEAVLTAIRPYLAALGGSQ